MIPHILAFMFAIYCIINGWRYLKDETFEMSIQVNPMSLFPKRRDIALKGKAAKFMGYETLIVGFVILVLIVSNLIFRFIDTNILLGAIFFGAIISAVYAHGKVYTMYKEEHTNRSL